MVQLSDQTKRTAREKDGPNVSESFEVKFSGELRNTSTAPVTSIRLRLIPFLIPYDFERKDAGHEAGKPQIQENITLGPSETLPLKFEPVTFSKSETVSKNRALTGGTVVGGLTTSATLTTITHSGNDYAGVVLEIYVGDKLAGTRFNGDGKLRKAYEEWVAKNPASTPASPVPAR
jgi:hypothetical protein